MVAILRHSERLLTEKATEAVIVGSNRKITEWIKGEVAVGRIQLSGTRISNNAIDQVDVQEINSITVPDYNTIPTQLAEFEVEYDILSCIATAITNKFEGNL